MGQLKNFVIECEEAGADVDRAIGNFSQGMLWDQAIAEATPTPEERAAQEGDDVFFQL